MTFTNETLRSAIVASVEECSPLYGDYATDIRELLEYTVNEVFATRDAEVELSVIDLDDYDGEKNAAWQDIAEDFALEVISDFEGAICNGAGHDWADTRVIYTADIEDYYRENTQECDEALMDCYGGLGDFDTIGEAMSAAVALAVSNQADSELWETHNVLDMHLVGMVRDAFELGR